MMADIDLTKLANELSFWPTQHSTSIEGTETIKCVVYRMEKGVCLRTNNLLAYCEANRLVCIIYNNNSNIHRDNSMETYYIIQMYSKNVTPFFLHIT